MSTIRSVYMMTDMEGVAGVDMWDPRHYEYANEAKGVYERSEIQRLLTGEVNAAAGALFEAGVEEVIVNDGHGAGRTILPEDLISGIKIARGKMRPRPALGLSPTCDALVQVGMHAMGGTPNGCLAHTMSRGKYYKVNDIDVGEMEIAAYIAGELGIPWIFTAGDSHACIESERFVDGIITAAVKEGVSELAAIHLAPVDARALIARRIREAVERAGEIKPLVPGKPVVLQIERDQPFEGELPEWVEKISDRVVRYHADSMWQAMGQAHYNTENLVPPV